MTGIACMCFVNPKGEFVGGPRVGVSRIQRRGAGGFLLDTRPPPGAAVRISALPTGYQARWAPVDAGLMIQILDRQGSPADHGFALVIEVPEATPTSQRLGRPGEPSREDLNPHAPATEK